MATYIFPGQGSQVKGMGGDLFTEFPEYTAQADKILGYSVRALCLEDLEQQLNQTQFTQPALYVVNALTALKKTSPEKKINYAAGHSLGEYNALLAAGVFDFETGLKLVKKRGELMSQASGGAMAAIIGLNTDAIKTVLTEQNLNHIAIANYNSHTQTVISGQKSDIEHALPIFEKSGAKMVIPLKVSGAFHSPHMRAAQTEFAMFLKEFHFSPPKFPVIANATAEPYPATQMDELLAKQITHSVRWTETIDYLLAQGETEFEECGPGTVLTGLIKRIKNGQ
jgi:malonyl CoA-acyl carrier protein transacylase